VPPAATAAFEITQLDLPAQKIQAIEQAAPDRAPAKPAKPRKVLVYGRVPTHSASVPPCFKAVEILGKKTGAFETVSTGDPAAFLPENLRQFDAVVMNNTHETEPMLPLNFKSLDPDRQAAARRCEAACKKSLIEFVRGGKGLAGMHGAAAVWGKKWPEYLDMIGGEYAGHFVDKVWIRSEEPGHPLCAALEGKSFEIRDEIYGFGPPVFSRAKVRVLLTLDLSQGLEPKNRPDKDYAVSWVRPYGDGRVFYCSLGHFGDVYANPHVLRHYLAGIQFAIGDLKAEAGPRGTETAPATSAAKPVVEVREVHDKSEGSAVNVKIDGETMVVKAISPRGIGGVRIALTSGEWPKKVKVLLAYSKEKPFGKIEGAGAALEKTGTKVGEDRKNLEPTKIEGGFELTIPATEFKVLYIHWVDFWRN
jgi:hypothetical protein